MQLTQAKADYRRRQASAEGGAVSAEEIRHARDALTVAAASLRATRSALKRAQVKVEVTSVDDNPNVLAAITTVHDAAITLSHMRLTALLAGVVAQRTAQIGEQVAVGAPLMAGVPLQRVWADIYGDGVTYHGRVQGLGGNRCGVRIRATTKPVGELDQDRRARPSSGGARRRAATRSPVARGALGQSARRRSRRSRKIERTDPEPRVESGNTDARADRIVARILLQNEALAPPP